MPSVLGKDIDIRFLDRMDFEHLRRAVALEW